MERSSGTWLQEYSTMPRVLEILSNILCSIEYSYGSTEVPTGYPTFSIAYLIYSTSHWAVGGASPRCWRLLRYVTWIIPSSSLLRQLVGTRSSIFHGVSFWLRYKRIFSYNVAKTKAGFRRKIPGWNLPLLNRSRYCNIYYAERSEENSSLSWDLKSLTARRSLSSAAPDRPRFLNLVGVNNCCFSCSLFLILSPGLSCVSYTNFLSFQQSHRDFITRVLEIWYFLSADAHSMCTQVICASIITVRKCFRVQKMTIIL